MEIDSNDLQFDYGESIILREYDDNGNLIKEKFKNRLEEDETVWYNKYQRVSQILIGKTQLSQFEYNDDGNLIHRGDIDYLFGSRVETDYDKKERPKLSIQTSKIGRITTNSYSYDDKNNKMTKETICVSNGNIAYHIKTFFRYENNSYKPETFYHVISHDKNGKECVKKIDIANNN